MGVNAVTSVPTYTDGEILEASRLNVTNSGIPVFATTTTRDAAFGGTGEKVLAEGQFAYIEASNTTQYYDGTSWLGLGGKIGQVLGVSKTDRFFTTSTTFVDLTTMTLTITPTATTSKILVGYNVIASGLLATNMGCIQLVRGATNILVADAAGSRSQASSIVSELNGASAGLTSNIHLDSPATTSATTYKLQIRSAAAGTLVVNQTHTDTDNANWVRGCSTMFVMEVLA